MYKSMVRGEGGGGRGGHDYKSEFKIVGFYIKEHMNFNVRHDTKIYIKWSGDVIIVCYCNIDFLNENKQAQRRHKDILHSFPLRQHITKATRKSKTSIDHVISTIPNGVIHHDILHTEKISDHDAPYIIFNIKKEKYQPCYRFISSEKTFDMSSYIFDFQQLSLSLVYPFDDPEDHVSIFTKVITECINTHALLRKVKLTRPAAS